MKLAQFEVSSDLLREFLHLPADVELKDAWRQGMNADGSFNLLITAKSEEFADVPKSSPIPTRSPMFKEVDGKVEFAGWLP